MVILMVKLVVWCETVLLWSNTHAPPEDHSLAHHREPYALEGWILEI